MEDGKLENAPRLGVGVAMAGPGPLLAAGHCVPMLPCEGTGRPAAGSSCSLPVSPAPRAMGAPRAGSTYWLHCM